MNGIPGKRDRSLRVAAVAAAGGALGALTAIVAGAAGGMGGAALAELALLFGIGVVITALAVAIAARALSRADLRRRLLGAALASGIAGLINLGVLAALMVVDAHDAALVAVLLLYSLGVGAGTALALTEPSADAVEEAVESQRRDLITAVSHDLRTPLASLRAMIEAIDDGVVEDPETLRLYTAEMRRSAGALTVLVDDLFELIQLDVAAIQDEGSATLDQVVSAALAACGTSAAEKGLYVEADVGPAEGRASCSPRLGRVLQNLLQNAIRHTPADGTVKLEANLIAGQLEVAIEDSGEGIAPESLPRVFDPFWRGDASRTSDGSGIGLTLSKRIVESLGGRIQVESAPDSGSRFAVLLPEADRSQPAQAPELVG